MPYLVALTGPYSGEIFEVKEGQTTVGRGPACTLLLDRDAAVSRAHAMLVAAGGVLQVHDAGSTHGVYVNGRRTDRGILRTGDCVQFGGSTFQVQPVPAQVSEPPRLRVIVPHVAHGNPHSPQEAPISMGMAITLYLLAAAIPWPIGTGIASTYLRKKNPVNQAFGAKCMIVSLVSLVAGLVIAGLAVWKFYPWIKAGLDAYRGLSGGGM